MAKFIWGIKNTLSKDPAIIERLSHLSDINFEYSDFSNAKINSLEQRAIEKSNTIRIRKCFISKVLIIYKGTNLRLG